MSQSQRTDFESQTQDFEMPATAGKRKRSDGSAGSRKRAASATRGSIRVPRGMAPGANANTCIVPLTVNRDLDLTADIAKGFAFDTEFLHQSPSNTYSIPGATEVQAVFSLMRLHKVEVTILPAATGLDYSAQTVGTGVTNIPFVYEAVDYDDYGNPTLSNLQQNATCRVHSLNKPIKRTLYPRLEGNTGIVDVGTNRRNLFKKGDSGSSQKWHGWKVYIDMANQVWTYGSVRIVFKLFYECMQTK